MTSLFKMFGLSVGAGEKLLSLLLSYGVLVPVRQGGSETVFMFCFVGIIFLDKLIIRCFPKYIRSTDAPHAQFAQVMDVIRRYGRESLAADPLHLYGTTAFEAVWEAVCAKAFGNQLNTPLKDLPLPSGLNLDYRDKEDLELIELIEKPKWNLADARPFEGNGTLIPDIAAFFQHNGETTFFIFDAKYYTYEPSANRLPRIGDIDKQYLYELAFKPFLEAHGITRVKNIFLMPTEGAELEYKGYVELPMLRSLGLENIQIVLVPAEKIYEYYLDNGRCEKSCFVSRVIDTIL